MTLASWATPTARSAPGARQLTELLRSRLKPYRKPVLLLMALQLAQALAALYLPTLNADIVDNGVITGHIGYILRVGAGMLAVTVVQIACGIGAVRLAARTATGIGADLRTAVFERVQRFSLQDVGRFGVASLTTRTTNDVQQVQMLTTMALTLIVSAPMMCVGGIVMALDQNVRLSLLLLIVLPLLVVFVALLTRRMRPPAHGVQNRLDRANRVLREQISGVRVIRAFGRDAAERERFGRTNAELMDVSLGFGRLVALMFPTVLLVMNLSSVAVLWFGGHLVENHGMRVGLLGAFLNYLMQILMSVMTATFVIGLLPRAEVCAERIQEVLRTPESVSAPTAPRPLPAGGGVLELRNVGFAYPSAQAPVLRDINLVATPGRRVAIVGSTGSGKSTLLGLVPRLLDATEGAVLIDGVDVRELDPRELAAAVGLVPQTALLFAGTIASNLRYGRSEATDDDLWHALETAQAREFVAALPAGLESPVAPGGVNFSGGQRQRLTIARTLVVRPRIYLFDESFSALDTATEAALRGAMARETGHATVLVVAQRTSTVRDADLIVVLDEGRVAATGTHHELMAESLRYQEIVLAQLTEEEAA